MGRYEYTDEDGYQVIVFADGPLPGTTLAECFRLMLEIDAAERGIIEPTDEEFAELWHLFWKARDEMHAERVRNEEQLQSQKQSEPAP